MTMSRSTNGSIIVHKERSDSVSLLTQFEKLEKNINRIVSTNELLEAHLETIHEELNKTKNDLQMDINLVSVSENEFNKALILTNYNRIIIQGKFEW